MPKISIIIPVYNVGKYVTVCLESILKQTYRDFEAIVIDDGSVDNSPGVCDEFARRDSRIRVFHIPNGGVSNALNVGLANAAGEWLYFVDGDDWIEEKSLEMMMSHIQKEAAIDVLCFNNYVNTDREEKNVPMLERFWTGKDVDILAAATIFPKYIEKKYKVVLPVIRCRWSKMIKKQLVVDNNIFFKPELTLGQDADFCAEVFAVAKCVLTSNDYLYHYRSFNESNSNKYREKWNHLIYRVSYLNSNEKVSKNNDFEEVKGLLILSLAKTMMVRFLCHPECIKTFSERNKILKNFLYAKEMECSFSFFSILRVLPFYIPFLFLLKFKMSKTLLLVGKLLYRMKSPSAHS